MKKEIVVKVALFVWTENEEHAAFEEAEGLYTVIPSTDATVLGVYPITVLKPSTPRYGGFAAGAEVTAEAVLATAAAMQGVAIVRALTSISRWFEPVGWPKQ